MSKTVHVARRTGRCAVALLAAVALLSGCGQKGNLYLPTAAPAASAPASR